jgi:FkbM family methyltransferase
VASVVWRAARRYREAGLAGIAQAIGTRIGLASPASLVETISPLEGVFEWLAHRGAYSIVQIGAFVGDTSNDPLYRFVRQSEPGSGSVVVLVEPVREFYEQLVRNYAGVEAARFENVAVAAEAGLRDFYRLGVDPTRHGHSEWLLQLGSLREDRMTSLWNAYEIDPAARDFYLAHRVVEQVECVTFEQLAARHGIQRVDLLQIDAEGSDYEILRSIDFARHLPRFVNYERVLMGETEAACRTMMLDAGYILLDWGQDTLCIHVSY